MQEIIIKSTIDSNTDDIIINKAEWGDLEVNQFAWGEHNRVSLNKDMAQQLKLVIDIFLQED